MAAIGLRCLWKRIVLDERLPLCAGGEGGRSHNGSSETALIVPSIVWRAGVHSRLIGAHLRLRATRSRPPPLARNPASFGVVSPKPPQAATADETWPWQCEGRRLRYASFGGTSPSDALRAVIGLTSLRLCLAGGDDGFFG